MQIILTILLTIFVFGIIIFVHELGHFLVAKWSGIKINEFALGMGPKLFGFKKGETYYNIRLFPIGGFVDMEGEDSSSDDERAFNKKTIYKRIAVILAGATMNILLGFLLLNIIVSMQPKISSTTIAKFKDDSISNSSGLMVNDKIIKIDGAKILVDNDIIYKLSRAKDGIVDMQVLRNNEYVHLNNVKFPTFIDEKGNNFTNLDFFVKAQDKNIINILKESFFKTISIARLVWLSLIDLITGIASVSDLSGPIGVASAIGEASSIGISSFLFIFAFITINIGIFNLLPFPALDGGRFIFLLIESIRKKPIKPEIEGYIHITGFALLILLILFVTFNDIFKFFQS